MMRFKDQAFVITGGTSGIGLAVARRIIEEGGRVLATGSNPDRLHRLRDAVPGVAVFLNDASDLNAAGALAAEARRLFGMLDGVFLNAGVATGAMNSPLTTEGFRRLMDLNVGGPLFGAVALEPLVRDRGSILITASIAKDRAFPGHTLYSATKGAVRAMVRGLARDYAPRGVRVNAISPGPIETDYYSRLGWTPDQLDVVKARIRSTSPFGRLGTPEEAAAVALFLLSDESTYVTGSDYAVDGGMAQI